MKDTQEESAVLKQALKKLPWTPELEAEAEDHAEEAGEALSEVENGDDFCVPGSWVVRFLAREDPEVLQRIETAGNLKKNTYMVVWSGGYEAPSYAAFSSEEAAWAQAREWEADIQEDEGDYIDVLRINPDLTVERLEAP